MTPTKSTTYFRSCEKSTRSPIEGKVKGTIPQWLSGTLIRNGPGIKRVGNDKYGHAFDGLALLHSFNIENGKVTYFNRPLESDVYNKNMIAQRITVSSFGTLAIPDPCDALYSKFKTDFVEGNEKKPRGATDNCNVSVCYHGDQLYAMTEGSLVRRIDPKTLGTIGEAVDLTHRLALNKATAHPHVLENGDAINIGTSFKPGVGLCYAFVRIPPKFDTEEPCYTEAKVIAEIPSRHAHALSYFHSFALAGDKIVLIEAPLWLNMKNFAEDCKTTPFVKLMNWNSEEKTRFYVVSMTTGQVHPVVYETDELFTLHHTNAYEEDGQIVIDLVGYDDGKFVNDHLFEDASDQVFQSGGNCRRYVLPLNVNEKNDKNLVTLKNTTATAHVIQNGDSVVVNVKGGETYASWMEFPRVNYNFNGKKYRYFYGAGSNKPQRETIGLPEPNILVKVDLESNTSVIWTEPSVVTHEPVFVANPNKNQEEDNGILLIPLLHVNDSKIVSLLILDAKTFKEVGRVEFVAEGTIPLSFHGEWASNGDKIHRF